MHSLNYWYYIASYKEQLLAEISPFLNLLHLKKKVFNRRNPVYSVILNVLLYSFLCTIVFTIFSA